jgi:hypothetical protein
MQAISENQIARRPIAAFGNSDGDFQRLERAICDVFILGGFEGRSIGIGPVLDYILPVEKNLLVAEARWQPELETRRRLAGDFFWLKRVYQF